MGTDIHSMLEIKTGDWEGEEEVVRWRRNTAAIFRYPYFYPEKPVSVSNTPYSPDPLRDRNYRLFAMLADVRNGRGFAGTDTGDRVEPIDEPRGVPEDASDEWKQEVEEWGMDLHSTSYFTLAELDAYDWDGLVFERGYVEEEAYLKLRDAEPGTSPTSWSGYVTGPGIISLTALEYEALTPTGLAALHRGDFSAFPQMVEREDSIFPEQKWGPLREGWEPRIMVQHQWAETKRQNMGELAEAMEVMRNSAPRHWDSATSTFSEPDTSAIRIVFGFDN